MILSTKRNFISILSVFILFVTCLSFSNAFAFQELQNDFKQYKGKIVEKNSNKEMVFATISLEGTNISTVSNTEGEFLLKVPLSIKEGIVSFSFLGHTTKKIPLNELDKKNNKIELEISITKLAEVNINAPKDAEALIREVLSKRGENYFNDPTLMTAFYRETIKKRRRNVSLSEAVVNIHKSSYASSKKDAVQLYKARKSTDYSKLDTVALKLQGGPFNTLYIDIMKYPEYIFKEGSVDQYSFSFDRSTLINDRQIYVIDFKQLKSIREPLYEGKLYIDVENKTLTSAVYKLNITNRGLASRLFVRKKPAKVDVWPTEVAYRVDYRNKNGKWYYGYSNVLLEFKVDWDDKLFNSVYSMTAEMAITDWKKNDEGINLKAKEKIKKSIILSDEAIGFSDPDFWGEYNIIEPEKSIESAIRKIQRQLKRGKNIQGAAAR
ncbi:carboxypeptidase-like regulatory domain-containing protein [Croceitalea rosinachiae]|uniref:Carboxypeptidase-like regulatory domain-containing protein n=1 Tax=Croceitalea rosinachiae TaxID=3075596 RepID=A0ABU3AI52_9FLAO|nr:carboxypeptidase-like regulatory domain-containing protein [Croceitalea sp. F388]MDT0608581.1 carboxypeptidase-like regulatory domain-containing protein [Croceitalea sp. F388]